MRRLTLPPFVALLTLTPGAKAQPLPPDTVTTLALSEPLDGWGSVGGLTADALGFLYVANFRDAVWRVSPDGTVKKLTDAMYGSSGNAVDARGTLYQSNFNANSITKISRTGEIETFADEGLNGPVGITVDPEGNLYVCNCNAGTISKVSSRGVVETFAESELLACPNGIVRDDRGDFYVVSFNNTVVTKISPDGQVSRFVDVPGAGGNGHVTFARGALFITKFRGHQVYRVSRDGDVSLVAGSGTRAEEDGLALDASFSSPNGITASPAGNILWVNDLVGEPGGSGPTRISLRRIRLVTLFDVLAEAAGDGDAGALSAAYAAYRAAKPGDDTRADAVRLGYRLLTDGHVAAALALFRLNAESYPADPSANFHLGECYRHTGQAEKARTAYRRVLELNPEHPQAGARLTLLSGGSEGP